MKKYFIVLFLTGCGGVFYPEEFEKIKINECYYRQGLSKVIINVNKTIVYFCEDGSKIKKEV